MPRHTDATLLRTETMLKTAMGPCITGALANPKVVEVMVNPDGCIWLDRHGDGRVNTGVMMPDAEAERVIRLVGSHIGQDVTTEHPIVSAELPGGGERFEGLIPPVTTAPSFSIRKAAVQIFTLDDYVDAGTLSPLRRDVLQMAIAKKLNILIVGGTGSGKTTLANALLHEVAKTGDRVVIIEDTRELQCASPDQVSLRTQAKSVTMADLVRSTMRLRPDRIIIGEVRGGEALDMLKAWNTGHPGGISTIHGNCAISGLQRLEQLVGEVSASIPRTLISQAIDMTVFIEGRGPDRRVSSIREVVCPDAEEEGEYWAPEYPDPVLKLVALPSKPKQNGEPS